MLVKLKVFLGIISGFDVVNVAVWPMYTALYIYIVEQDITVKRKSKYSMERAQLKDIEFYTTDYFSFLTFAWF